MSELKEYYTSIPPFTRYFMTVVFFSSFGLSYGLIKPDHIILDFEKVFKSFQIWRIFTNLVYAGKFS